MKEAELQTWLTAYGRAWATTDPGAAARLFSADAVYHETPFVEPARGREGVRVYWSAATKNHRDVEFSHEIVSTVGDRAIVRWRAEFTRRDTGVRVGLDGIFLLDFDPAGLCRDLREWWHRRELPRKAGTEPG